MQESKFADETEVRAAKRKTPLVRRYDYIRRRTMDDNDQVQAILDQVPQPAYVASIRHEFKEDWSGEPSVMILVVVHDGIALDTAFWARTRQYEQAIKEAIGAANLGYWPYVTFRTATEQAELDRNRRQSSPRIRAKATP